MQQRRVIVGQPGFVLCYRFTVCGRRRGPLRPSMEEAIEDAVAAGFAIRDLQHPRYPGRLGRAYLHPLAYIARGYVEPVKAARLIARGRGVANDGAVGTVCVRRRGEQSQLVDRGRVAVVTWL